MDLSRVGIEGNSYGGYFAIRAMLLAPDVYHVGVASAPMHMQENWGWDGVLLGNKEAYEYASNLNFPANLKGKLLLIHGTSDACAPFPNTMKMVDSLIRADKYFDLLVMPGQGHDVTQRLGRSESYWREAIRHYFQEHLEP